MLVVPLSTLYENVITQFLVVTFGHDNIFYSAQNLTTLFLQPLGTVPPPKAKLKIPLRSICIISKQRKCVSFLNHVYEYR